jgi:hypothetical protein
MSEESFSPPIFSRLLFFSGSFPFTEDVPIGTERIAHRLAQSALRGSTSAAEALADRAEGRPRQALEVTGGEGAPLLAPNYQVGFVNDEILSSDQEPTEKRICCPARVRQSRAVTAQPQICEPHLDRVLGFDSVLFDK